jgi:hypothetical protein
LEALQRGQRFSNLCGGQILNGRNDVARRVLEVGLQIAPADNALVGVEIDEYQRPVAEQTDFRDHRPPQRHQRGARVDRFECQLLKHGSRGILSSLDPNRSVAIPGKLS